MAFDVVLSCKDGMQYQSALFLDYIVSRGAYWWGFFQWKY